MESFLKGGITIESILTSIKKLLGIAEDYEHFDSDLIMHINSVFTILNQIGVGPKEGFYISDSYAVWNDYIPDGSNLEIIKTYMYMKVKLLFDPPLSSSVADSMQRLINEFEWRISAAVDPGDSDSVSDDEES